MIHFNQHIQERSKTFRHGEPPSHKKSCDEVERYCRSKGFQVLRDWAPPSNSRDYYHEYDLAIFSMDDFYKDEKEPCIIVEIGAIGDDSKHNPGHKQQMINDGIAQSYIKRRYKKTRFCRLNKDDCVFPDIEIRNDWLSKQLGFSS